MSPLSIMILCFASVALALALGSLNGAFARKPKPQYGRDDGQPDVQPERKPNITFQKIKNDRYGPPRQFGTRRYRRGRGDTSPM